MAKKTMEMWIREALTDPDKSDKCAMISLVHMVGVQQKEIHSTKTLNKTIDPVELSKMLDGKAVTYAQDLPGVQTFQLLAFYGESSVAQAFFPFRINSETELNGLGTEAPTEQGRLQQIMRREDSLLGQVYRRQQVMDDHSIRMMQMMSHTIEKLTSENRDAFTIVKEILMEKALSDHNHKMSQLQFERDSVERKKWLSFAPALINTLLGREIFPQGTADTALVESIADSLTEDDVMKLGSAMKPELWGPLAARMHQYMMKKAEEEKNLKAISQYASPDPEADAAGEVVSIKKLKK
jgi:hypothetical protein